MTDLGTWGAAADAGAFERLLASETCPPPGVMLLHTLRRWLIPRPAATGRAQAGAGVVESAI